MPTSVIQSSPSAGSVSVKTRVVTNSSYTVRQSIGTTDAAHATGIDFTGADQIEINVLNDGSDVRVGKFFWDNVGFQGSPSDTDYHIIPFRGTTFVRGFTSNAATGELTMRRAGTNTLMKRQAVRMIEEQVINR